jgi:hypothetical protein
MTIFAERILLMKINVQDKNYGFLGLRARKQEAHMPNSSPRRCLDGCKLDLLFEQGPASDSTGQGHVGSPRVWIAVQVWSPLQFAIRLRLGSVMYPGQRLQLQMCYKWVERWVVVLVGIDRACYHSEKGSGTITMALSHYLPWFGCCGVWPS